MSNGNLRNPKNRRKRIMKFLVVIPCYKEFENLKILVPSILEEYPQSRIMVVDDFSNDSTDELMFNLEKLYSQRIFYICRKGNPSYAESLMEGLKFSRNHNFEKTIQMDSDGSHSVHDIQRLLNSNANLTIGSRYQHQSKVVDVPTTRQLISIMSNIYISLLWRTKIRDKTNGFRCFDKDTVNHVVELATISNGFAIQIEVLRNLLQINKVTIKEVPVTFKYRVLGNSKFSLKKFLEALRVATFVKPKIQKK
jgi:glycosyltransferase involved in cell wall biosynthesis